MTRTAVAAAAAAVAGALLVSCGNADSGDSGPHKVEGEAAPAGGSEHADKDGDGKDGGKNDGKGGGGSKNTRDGSHDGASEGKGGEPGSGTSGPGGSSGSGTASGSSGGGSPSPGDSASAPGPGGGGRCATPDLRASFGPNHPGAGQKNFSVVLTNESGRTCTVHGYPGLAFVNDAGEEVSIDPTRAPGQSQTITLEPGSSAWAPLSYSNPEMTGVTTVDPAAARITPPDERASLTAPWEGGPVTNTGKASVPKIGPLAPGTGP
ncbi:DUF4232 domain-containing protein [Streptomyces albus subsp. chlorinus]|uniref:DUF4232 domain-containing protein n=1 Tax=Streptomyces albus TaxID=1888 RepID=UPI00156FEA54|nr:DUF4232 domain-containing protein [Streptomyces albus]NSC22552.1 DUF4232 domain-containing protein [Streptomyces albus subsp. chlorinus]